MTAPADRLSTPGGAQPFSRLLVVDDVPDDGLDQTVEADRAECDAIAQEIGIPAVAKLAATYRITCRPGHRIHVGGVVEAAITQICVVSLEPFDSALTQAVDLTFAPSARPEPVHRRVPTASRRREHPEPREPSSSARVVEGEDDPPEPIIDGRIDLGAVAVEFLTLALDFYPRKPGVQFSDVVEEPGDDKPSAFAALARLKDHS